MGTINAKDIQIYRNGAFRSLRDQKIYRSGSWRTFGAGSGIYKGGNWYALESLSSQVEAFNNYCRQNGLSKSVFYVENKIGFTDAGSVYAKSLILFDEQTNWLYIVTGETVKVVKGVVLTKDNLPRDVGDLPKTDLPSKDFGTDVDPITRVDEEKLEDGGGLNTIERSAGGFDDPLEDFKPNPGEDGGGNTGEVYSDVSLDSLDRLVMMSVEGNKFMLVKVSVYHKVVRSAYFTESWLVRRFATGTLPELCYLSESCIRADVAVFYGMICLVCMLNNDVWVYGLTEDTVAKTLSLQAKFSKSIPRLANINRSGFVMFDDVYNRGRQLAASEVLVGFYNYDTNTNKSGFPSFEVKRVRGDGGNYVDVSLSERPVSFQENYIPPVCPGLSGFWAMSGMGLWEYALDGNRNSATVRKKVAFNPYTDNRLIVCQDLTASDAHEIWQYPVNKLWVKLS